MPSRKRPSPAPPRRPRGASAVERTNRALRMLSDSNQALIRATDEAELLQQICRIAVERGGYRMAWVGLVGKDPARRVEPVAHAGFEEGYLATAGQVWGEGGSTGGPAAEALATGAVAITHDIPSDPAFGPRRETAKARGYRSAIALPLRDGEEPPFGVFKIYSTEPGAFDRDEVEILSELAGDLDVETFPSLLIADAHKARFLGPLLPHAAVLSRLIGSLRDAGPAAEAQVDPEAQALFSRVRSARA